MTRVYVLLTGELTQGLGANYSALLLPFFRAISSAANPLPSPLPLLLLLLIPLMFILPSRLVLVPAPCCSVIVFTTARKHTRLNTATRRAHIQHENCFLIKPFFKQYCFVLLILWVFNLLQCIANTMLCI